MLPVLNVLHIIIIINMKSYTKYRNRHKNEKKILVTLYLLSLKTVSRKKL